MSATRRAAPRLRLVSDGPPAGADRGAAPSDAQLLAGLARGDRACADAMYDRYAAYAERMLVRLCGQGPEIADLLHDVFLRAFERAHTIRDPAALRSWIVSVAVRRAREHLRRVARSRPRLDEVPPAQAAARDPEASLAVRRVYQLLDRLPPDDRIAFALRQIEGMKLTEVAEVCGVSLATAKRRIKRGSARFREMAQRDELLATWMGEDR